MKPFIARKHFNQWVGGLVASSLSASLYSNESSSQKATGLIYDEQYLKHELYKRHPESPDRLLAIMKQLKKSGLMDDLSLIKPAKHGIQTIESIHSKAHIEKVQQVKSYETILRAVQGVLTAVDLVSQKKLQNAFCAIRPPGHHAVDVSKRRRSAEYGFCYFGNVALAARYAQMKYKYKKILIVDWDYHHGNGTEWAFYDDPSVLFFSTHRLRAFPGTGSKDRIGIDDGVGFNINHPLERGAKDRDILNAFEAVLLPETQKFKPDFVLISAGFDSRKHDSLGDFEVSDEGFKSLTKIMKSIAKEYCDGRLVSVLEGGYNLKGLALATEAHLQILL